jgi:endogenous inhibitor of DNA gyrase (YacG/DUF329 family)
MGALRQAKAVGFSAATDLPQRKLMIQFTCPKCGRDLAWAYEYASVYCRACDRWIRAAELKQINPAKADPDADQLVLFE